MASASIFKKSAQTRPRCSARNGRRPEKELLFRLRRQGSGGGGNFRGEKMAGRLLELLAGLAKRIKA
jgi:hypothetical protein